MAASPCGWSRLIWQLPRSLLRDPSQWVTRIPQHSCHYDRGLSTTNNTHGQPWAIQPAAGSSNLSVIQRNYMGSEFSVKSFRKCPLLLYMPGYPSPIRPRSRPHNSMPLRQLHHKADKPTFEQDSDDHQEKESPDVNSGWIIRLANENGYLSWCRNAYIGTVVGITIFMQEPIVPYAKEAAFIFMLLSCLQLTCGTSLFLYNIIKLRRRIFLARGTALMMSIMAVLHLTLWLGGVAIYMGFVEEDNPPVRLNNEES